jgi:hypothetical protein
MDVCFLGFTTGTRLCVTSVLGCSKTETEMLLHSVLGSKTSGILCSFCLESFFGHDRPADDHAEACMYSSQESNLLSRHSMSPTIIHRPSKYDFHVIKPLQPPHPPLKQFITCVLQPHSHTPPSNPSQLHRLASPGNSPQSERIPSSPPAQPYTQHPGSPCLANPACARSIRRW